MGGRSAPVPFATIGMGEDSELPRMGPGEGLQDPQAAGAPPPRVL